MAVSVAARRDAALAGVPWCVPRGVPCRRPGRLLPPAGRQCRAIMADKPDKTNKLKARLPRGFADRGGAEIAATRRMLDKIRAVYERYGFEPLETPAIEYTDVLGKFLPDQDRPNEKPGPGRFREFMQFDADTVGSSSPAADAELCMMAADTMEALGIPRGGYVVKVNNRKVLDGVLDSIGLGGEANALKRLTVMRAIDKLDRLKHEGVKLLLGPGRKDESGDFTKGAGLTNDQINRILLFLSMGPMSNTQAAGVLSNSIGNSEIGQAGKKELDKIVGLCLENNYREGQIVIDPSVVRGLEYYTGPVFEVDLTFSTEGKDGA